MIFGAPAQAGAPEIQGACLLVRSLVLPRPGIVNSLEHRAAKRQELVESFQSAFDYCIVTADIAREGRCIRALRHMIEDIAVPQAKADDAWLDADLREMNLSYAEKSGLQIYRNYTRSFEEHNIGRFRDALNNDEHDFSALVQLTHLLVHEDIRFTPVILCGYADDALKSVFMDVLPADVPGGRSSMLSGYGPLSTLSERIRLAHAFTVLSQDLMTQLDAVRKVRARLIIRAWRYGASFA